MKRIITLSLFFSFLMLAANAQNAEGVINYEIKVNNHRMLSQDQEGMKAMVPEYRIFRQQLFFNSNESLFKPVEEEEDQEFSSGGANIRMRIPQTEIYLDQSTGRRVTMRDFMGKRFLIEDTLKISAWKFGTETKEILGYACKEAYFTNDMNQKVQVWYTDKLRASLGPEMFHSLPGAILEVNMNDGERTVTATKFDFRTLKKGELKIPSQGEKISEAAFRSMMQEQMKRMGGQGNRMIIRN
jgi:GLPGLI family protein